MAVSTIKRTPTVANNLTTTTEGSVLDARQGKALSDQFTNLVIVKQFSYVISSLSEGRTATVTASNLKYAIPDGYFPIGFSYLGLGNNVLLQRVNLTDPTASIVKCKNTSSSSMSDVNVGITVAFMKTGMIDNQIVES